jgi:hypothetical protein
LLLQRRTLATAVIALGKWSFLLRPDRLSREKVKEVEFLQNLTVVS